MRIGASILLFDGYCYQSYGWQKFRPFGELQGVVDSLEKYQVDEIAVIRPFRDNDSVKKFDNDISVLKKLNSMTPLSLGGGLRSKEHIDKLHGLPIERLIFSSAFIQKDYELIEYAVSLYGRQAVQALLPFRTADGQLEIFHSSKNIFVKYDDIDIGMINRLANEIVLSDVVNEGVEDSFNTDAIDDFSLNTQKVVISGGIGRESTKVAKQKDLASVLIENRVLHSEYSIKGYKNVM